MIAFRGFGLHSGRGPTVLSSAPALARRTREQLHLLRFLLHALPPHLAGDSRGCVHVYKIVGVDLSPAASKEEQARRLRRAVLKSDTEA